MASPPVSEAIREEYAPLSTSSTIELHRSMVITYIVAARGVSLRRLYLDLHV